MKELTDLISSLQRLNDIMNNETRVMTCSEAAYVLGKNPVTISRYITEGKLHKDYANGVNGVRAKEVFDLIMK